MNIIYVHFMQIRQSLEKNNSVWQWMM